MSMSTYTINGVVIPWGLRFREVAPLLSHFEQFTPYPTGWANLHVKGTTVFGLNCPVIEVRAPFPDRPILQVIYQLAPLDTAYENGLHPGFLEQLKTHLGDPDASASYYNASDWRKGLSQYGVVYTAAWERDDVRISLSVYGGTRTHTGGPHAAALYVQWTNEQKAAETFVEPMKQLMQHVSDALPSATIHRLRLEHKQAPFLVRHFENKDPNEAEHNESLRMAQLALYRNDFLPLPAELRTKLSEYDVCVFRIPEMKKTFIANKWDAVYLADNEDCQPIFFEIHPARGPGGRELEVKQLCIHDSARSNALLDVVQWVERLSGVKTIMSERADD